MKRISLVLGLALSASACVVETGIGDNAPDPQVQATPDAATVEKGLAGSPNGLGTSPDGAATSPDGVASSPDGVSSSPNGFGSSPDGLSTSPGSTGGKAPAPTANSAGNTMGGGKGGN